MKNINYNPDILNYLANLSSDEVFTPPNVVNDMLDLLPDELWSNAKATFLDPGSKSGVFLREIAKRLMEGLKEQIPDQQERINHIFKNQLFGLPITELTAYLSRRSVYGSKTANGKYAFPDMFDDEQGNIKFERIEHTWKNGRCIYCRANEDVYDRDIELETYAYSFIHSKTIDELFNKKDMKFDVIIGNPPYQLGDGSGASSDAAMPIYNKFIEQSINLSPRYLVMITPSKWMVGGRGLNKFRDNMINDTRLKYIYDFENASDCFPGLHIDGGVSYFLWDRDYQGKTTFTYRSNDGIETTVDKYLKNNFSNYVIRDNRVLSILEKVYSKNRFSSIVSTTRPFGIRKYLFNSPERYPTSNLKMKPFKNSIKIYGVKGIKGGARRIVGYIDKNIITNNIEAIEKYKLFFTTSYSTNAVQPPETIIGLPKEICTETFLMIGPFKNEKEQLNCNSYIQTDFFKFLLYFGKGTMQVTRRVFDLIPLQDFSKKWTDELLYKKYKLDSNEILFIKEIMNPSK